MLINYFKTAWRNLIRQKVSSTINIVGLAVGIAVALLNGLWIWDELSFDTYHQNSSTIAQVMKEGAHKGVQYAGTSLQYPLAMELKTTYGSHFKHLFMAWQVQEYILASSQTTLSKQGLFIEAGAPDMLP